MKPLRHWLRWLSIACGRALYAARPLPACAWLVALVLWAPAAHALKPGKAFSNYVIDT